MKTNHHLAKLTSHILSLSVSDTFSEAIKEWKPVGVTIASSTSIKYNCYIRNLANGNETIVGSTCVERFLGISTIHGVTISKLFTGLNNLVEEPLGKPSREVITFASKAGFIYGNEVEFLTKILDKHSELTDRQLAWLSKINRRITNKIEVTT